MSAPISNSMYGQYADLQRYTGAAPAASGSIYLSGSLGSEKVYFNTKLDVSSKAIENLADPTNDQDAATKAYVDSQLTGQDLDFQGDTGGALSIDLDSETLTISGGTGLSSVGSGNAVTINIDEGGVGTTQLAADAVTGDKIADDQVDSEHLVAGSIDTEHLGALQVTGAKLAADCVTSDKIADDQVDSEHLVAGSIDTEHIGALQVTGAKLAADCVDGNKIADDAVDSEHIADGAIDGAHLASDVIDSTKLADDSVNSEHLVDGSVDNVHLAGSITANKMNGAIFEDLETLGAASADGEFIVATGAGAFAYESGNDARTSLGLGTGDSPTFTSLTLSAQAGSLGMNSQKIVSLATPTADADAATKGYVDSVAQGLSAKDSVRAATTDAGTLASDFANGDAVDGVTLATGDRILIKNQADASENGIYVVAASGAPARAADMDAAAEFEAGAFVFVEEGTVNADSGFVLTTDGDITVDTTDLAFTQFSGAGSIVAGDALTKTGNQLDVAVDDSSLEVSGDALQVKALGIATGMLAADAVTGAKIADDAVDSEHLAAGSIDPEHLAASSVETVKIRDAAVTTVKLAADAVDGTKLADDSVDSEHLVDGSVDAVHLAGSIPNSKLSNASITLSQGAGMAAMGEVALGASVTVAVDGVLEDLDTLGAPSSDGQFIVATGAGAFAYESGNDARTSLGLGTGDSPQFTDVICGVGAGYIPFADPINSNKLRNSSLFYSDGTSLAAAGDLVAQPASSAGAIMLSGSLRVQGASLSAGAYAIDVSNASGNDSRSRVRANAFVTYSARELKKDVKDISNPMAKLNALRPVTYNWKGGDVKSKGWKSEEVGFIADEVQQVLPQIVQAGPDGKAQGIDYSKLTAVLTQAVKVQDQEIQDLKAQLSKVLKALELKG